MSAVSDTEIFKTMIRFGGSFVAAIGQAGLYADSGNVIRLKRAFPDYFLMYETMAQMNKTPHED